MLDCVLMWEGRLQEKLLVGGRVDKMSLKNVYEPLDIACVTEQDQWCLRTEDYCLNTPSIYSLKTHKASSVRRHVSTKHLGAGGYRFTLLGLHHKNTCLS